MRKERKLHCNILLSKFYLNSAGQSDSDDPDAAENVLPDIGGLWEVKAS